MPGFLEVFGYYSEDLGKWNIDVRFLAILSSLGAMSILTPSVAAHRATADLLAHDDRHLCFLPDGGTVQRPIRATTGPVGGLAVELRRHEHPAGHHQ